MIKLQITKYKFNYQYYNKFNKFSTFNTNKNICENMALRTL